MNEYNLPETGFLRVKQIVGPGGFIPVSRSTWWQGVKEGKYPKPAKISENVTAWRAQDIRQLIDRLGAGGER